MSEEFIKNEGYSQEELDKQSNYDLVRRNADRQNIADRLDRSIGMDKNPMNIYAAFQNELTVLLGDIYASYSMSYIGEENYIALAQKVDSFASSEKINSLKRESKDDDRTIEQQKAFEEVVSFWDELSKSLI